MFMTRLLRGRSNLPFYHSLIPLSPPISETIGNNHAGARNDITVVDDDREIMMEMI